MITVSEYLNGNTDKTSSFILQIPGAIPVPVGHRVEIRIFCSEGLFGIGGNKPLFEYPLIKDMETGIQYGDLDNFDTGKNASRNMLPDAQITLQKSLNEYANLKGKILACNVNYKHISLYELFLQTTLLIEPENS